MQYPTRGRITDVISDPRSDIDLIIGLLQNIYFIFSYNTSIYLIWDVDDNKHLLDKAMADIAIYSVEPSNIRRGRRPSWILS